MSEKKITKNKFPMLTGKTVVAGGSKHIYTWPGVAPNETTFIELHFDDGSKLELKASTVSFDQYDRGTPIIQMTYTEETS